MTHRSPLQSTGTRLELPFKHVCLDHLPRYRVLERQVSSFARPLTKSTALQLQAFLVEIKMVGVQAQSRIISIRLHLRIPASMQNPN